MQKLLISFVIFSLFVSLSSATIIKAITYVIGQNAFRDAPDRYAEFVTKALAEAKNYPVNDIIDVHSCKTSYWIYGSRSVKTFTIAPGSLQINIVPDGIVVNANVNAYISVPTKIQWRKKFGVCFSHTICDNTATLTGNFQLSVKFTANWQQQGITITAVPTINGDNFNINGCNPPGWMNIFADVKQIMYDKIQQQINIVISNTIRQFNIPNIYSPFPGTYFSYQVTNVQFTANDRIIITASCVVQADKKNNNGTVTRLTFTDPDQSDADLQPPVDWNLGLNGTLFQLQGIRWSSTLLEAFIWSAQTIGAFNTTYTTPFLDTKITFVSELTPPRIGINKDNYLTVDITCGRTYIECQSDNSSCVNMLDVSYANLEGNGTIYATPDNIGVVIQVISFNISGNNIVLNWPPLPVPQNFIQAIENIAFEHLIPNMNSFLKNNPLTLPENIATLIPNPSLRLVNQPGCCNSQHGYLDFASYCSVNDNLVPQVAGNAGSVASKHNHQQWMRCQFPLSKRMIHQNSEVDVHHNMFSRKETNEEGIYIVQYNTQNCVLTGTKNNAALIYVRSNVSSCITDDTSGLFVANEINGTYHVGIYCNNSCILSSCEIIIRNVIFENCYKSITIHKKDSVRIMSEPGHAIVASFGQSNTSDCKISSESNQISTFTLLTEFNSCDSLGDDLSVQMNNDKYLTYKQSCNQSCSECKVNTEYIDTSVCLRMKPNKFKWYDEDHLPNMLEDGFFITFIENNHSQLIKDTIRAILLATLIPVSVIIIILIIFGFLFRNRTKKILCFCFKQTIKCIVIFGKIMIIILIGIANCVGNICKWLCGIIASSIKRLALGIKNFYFGSYKKNKLPIGIETYACLFSLMITTIVLILWLTNDPFIDYVQSILDKLKIPNNLVCQSEKGFNMLDRWSKIMKYGSITILILNFALATISVFFRTKVVVVVSLFVELVFGFASIHIPPIFFKFQDMIVFGSCQSPFVIAGNTTIPDFVINFMEPKIQSSFIGLGMASLTNWNLFWLQGLLGGCITGCLYFWINYDYQSIRKGFFAIIGIAVPIVISVPLSSIIAIIFLYQGFNVDVKWLSVWLIWWTISILMLFIIVISSYYNIVNNNLKIKYRSSENRRFFGSSVTPLRGYTAARWFLLITYIILHLLVLIYALYRESQLTVTNIQFALGCWLFPIGQLLPLFVLILDYCSDHSDSTNAIQGTGDAEYHQLDAIQGTNDAEYYQLDAIQGTSDIASDNDILHDNTSFRNILYLVGTIALAVSLFMTLHEYLYEPLMNDILKLLKNGDQNLEWPKNGTVFDSAIMTYSTARWNQFYFNVAALIILCVIVILNLCGSHFAKAIIFLKNWFVNIFCKNNDDALLSFSDLPISGQKNDKISFSNSEKTISYNNKIIILTKLLGYISMILLFVGLIMVASPNYLDSMDLDKYLPNCTTEFNHLISQSIKMSIGFLCAMIFSAKVSIIAITFSPAVARSANILLLGKISKRGNYALLWMWVSSSLFGSVMTILPIIFIMQTIGDDTILILTVIFWVAPFIVSIFVCFIKLNFNYNGYLAIVMIFFWSICYIGPIVSLIFYSAHQYNLWSYVIDLLWDVNFWASLIAEFALSLAIPSDFIESCINICKYLEQFEPDSSINNPNPKNYGTIN